MLPHLSSCARGGAGRAGGPFLPGPVAAQGGSRCTAAHAPRPATARRGWSDWRRPWLACGRRSSTGCRPAENNKVYYSAVLCVGNPSTGCNDIWFWCSITPAPHHGATTHTTPHHTTHTTPQPPHHTTYVMWRGVAGRICRAQFTTQ